MLNYLTRPTPAGRGKGHDRLDRPARYQDPYVGASDIGVESRRASEAPILALRDSLARRVAGTHSPRIAAGQRGCCRLAPTDLLREPLMPLLVGPPLPGSALGV